ncbi:MAG: NUDIX hydrolase [Elusimicrobia bacterium]|nr:MAG: NUDIX hydrolase [Elusimicrobiota bacterium]
MMERFETAAGGLVLRKEKVLIVRVRVSADPKTGELRRGDSVWSFPKGHVEPGETLRRAAAREVFEETGWECSIARTVADIRYSFSRGGHPTRKRVRWYLMEPVRRTGRPDPDEILSCRWADFNAARRLLRYPSDLRLLSQLEKAA